MASVQSSRGKKQELYTVNGDQPTCHIESEGDRLIKRLCTKQLDKHLTLEKQKQFEKEFERGSGFVPLSVYQPGSSTVEQITDLATKAERLEELQIRGLTLKEATAVINGEDLTFPGSKVEESVRISRAEEIRNIIERKNNVEGNQQKSNYISRHEKELNLAVKPQSMETKLLQFAMSCQKEDKKDSTPLDHPINKLPELEKFLFADPKPEKLANTIKRKRKQFLKSSLPPQGAVSVKDTENSLWDVDMISKVSCETRPRNINKYITCRNQRFYTLKDGKIVELDKKHEEAKVETKNKTESYNGEPFVALSCNEKLNKAYERLTESQIKSMERFKNYERGNPSQVLYIKNLGNNVNEDDLVQLFSKFQEPGQPCITYRLMTGKMKGQAFVTFTSQKVASLALDNTNGTIIKGKPIVIQFGKSSTSETKIK